jgi:hypothetical protein
MTRELVLRVMAFSWHPGGNVGDFPQAGLEVLSVSCMDRSKLVRRPFCLPTDGLRFRFKKNEYARFRVATPW